uniref:Uncharacterized protein n=1 Tax=Salmo trutta TaxID=8032 RepID=A0A673Z7U9_SALTR
MITTAFHYLCGLLRESHCTMLLCICMIKNISSSHLIQTVLQVLDCDLQVFLHPLQVRAGVSLHLLLHPQGIIPAPDLRVQGALHGVHHPLAIPLDLLHFLVLLSQLPVHLALDLVQLQLHSQNLGFLVLQCSLDKEKQSGELCSIHLDVYNTRK